MRPVLSGLYFLWTSSIPVLLPVLPVPRLRKATAGGERAWGARQRAQAHSSLGSPMAVPWVVPRLSQGLPRGLSHGCPVDYPQGCPAVVLRVSRSSIYTHVDLILRSCVNADACTNARFNACAHTCTLTPARPVTTSKQDGARTKSVHTHGGKTMWHDNNDNCMMHLPRTPLPQTQS